MKSLPAELLEDEDDSLDELLEDEDELLEDELSDEELLLELEDELELCPSLELLPSALVFESSVSDERVSSILEELFSLDDELVGMVQAHKASIINESTPNFNFDSTAMALLIIG